MVANHRANMPPAATPVIARAVLKDVPQLSDFGCSRSSLLQFLDRGIEVPPEVDWVA